mgnify:CR=1 FL=1
MSDQTAVLKALASPVRRAILTRLEAGETAAGALGEGLGVAPATLSEHLATLRTAGLISLRKERAWRFYSLAPGALDAWRPGLSGATPVAASEPVSGAQTVAVITATAGLNPRHAFEAFTDAGLAGAWLGAAVSLRDGQFACDLADGLRLRASFLLTAAPSLIVMAWDARRDGEAAALRQARTDLVIAPRGVAACQLRVCQSVGDAVEAERAGAIWRDLLARFAARAPDAVRAARRTGP